MKFVSEKVIDAVIDELDELEEDYGLMTPMFFRDQPDWRLILKTIEEFERKFNA